MPPQYPTVAASILSACALFAGAVALAEPPAPNALTVNGALSIPAVPAVRAAAPPAIDGDPSDPCWAAAPVLTGFTCDTRPPALATEARALCDDRALYFLFTCHDPQPDRIRAQQRKRNGGMDADDQVEVGLDTRFDRSSAYWFAVNPLGTQREDIPGGSATKVEWRGDWQAASRVTADGWTAEMRIPFAILRYPRGQRAFGLMLGRYSSRHQEWSNWPHNTKPYMQDNEARWADLPSPRLAPVPRVMPYVLAGTGAYQSSAGLDAKITTQDDVTGLLTVHPDFQTVEEMVQSVDFSYNPKYVEDYRPFFTEGEDFYDSDFGFYPHAIGKVDGGAKAFGKVGPWRFAGLAATRLHEESDGVGYLRYEPSPRLAVWGGGLALRRDPRAAGEPSLHSTVRLMGAQVWKPASVGGYGASVEHADGHTAGPGGDGQATTAYIYRQGGDGVVGWDVEHTVISPDYVSPLSYVDRTNIRKWAGRVKKSWQVRSGRSRYRMARLAWDWSDQVTGGKDHRGLLFLYEVSMRNDTNATAYYEAGKKRNYNRAPLPSGAGYNSEETFDDSLLNLWYGWRQSDSYRGGGVYTRFGRLAGGPYVYAELNQGMRFTSAASCSLGASYVHMDGALERDNTWRLIANGLYEFSPERSLAGRIITGHAAGRYEGSPLRNAYLAFRQELRHGADIYVIVGNPNTNSIQTPIAAKYVATY